MNEIGLILAVLAGVIVGIAGGLLLLAGKNKQIEELKTELKGLGGESTSLRDKLANESGLHPDLTIRHLDTPIKNASC